MINKKTIFFVMIFSVICLSFIMTCLLNSFVENNFPKTYPAGLRPKRYSRNSHTRQNVFVRNGQYHYSYTFKNLANRIKTWSWKFDKKVTDRMINKFGLPMNYFQSYYATDAVIRKRKRDMINGMYMEKKGTNYIVPDLNRISNYYMKTSKPIFDHWNSACQKYKYSKRRQIQLLMHFCQDIPYGVGPSTYNNKQITGLLPPPLVMNLKWGDCDSKATLFASILGQMNKFDFVFVDLPSHVLLGIRAVPNAYDKRFRYMGKTYIACEPVGPRRSPPGWTDEIRSNFSRVSRIYPFKLLNQEIESITDNEKIKEKNEKPIETEEEKEKINSAITNNIPIRKRYTYKMFVSQTRMYLNISQNNWEITDYRNRKKVKFRQYDQDANFYYLKRIGGKKKLSIALAKRKSKGKKLVYIYDYKKKDWVYFDTLLIY